MTATEMATDNHQVRVSSNHRRLTLADGLFACAITISVGLWGYTRLWQAESGVTMPIKVADEAERELYLTPGGIYTATDIESNGNMTASERFVGFRAEHDFSPRPGDQLCPITRTKANEDCAWVIAGRRYTFCCPPCIDEFLEVAKNRPESVLPPQGYTK